MASGVRRAPSGQHVARQRHRVQAVPEDADGLRPVRHPQRQQLPDRRFRRVSPIEIPCRAGCRRRASASVAALFRKMRAVVRGIPHGEANRRGPRRCWAGWQPGRGLGASCASAALRAGRRVMVAPSELTVQCPVTAGQSLGGHRAWRLRRPGPRPRPRPESEAGTGAALALAPPARRAS
jgi:hypothetical protein